MKYGGNSPRAVPAPHMNASRRTLLRMAHSVTEERASVAAPLATGTGTAVAFGGQMISSGYGGSGNLRLSHSNAANVTEAMWGPYNTALMKAQHSLTKVSSLG